jgi:hypothetical protein
MWDEFELNNPLSPFAILRTNVEFDGYRVARLRLTPQTHGATVRPGRLRLERLTEKQQTVDLKLVDFIECSIYNTRHRSSFGVHSSLHSF